MKNDNYDQVAVNMADMVATVDVHDNLSFSVDKEGRLIMFIPNMDGSDIDMGISLAYTNEQANTVFNCLALMINHMNTQAAKATVINPNHMKMN